MVRKTVSSTFNPNYNCMPTFITLLRGVNVSGQKKINMKELKSLFESSGLRNVQTYIQSGNVVFESDDNEPEKLTVRLESAIATHFGFEVTVVLLTPEALLSITANNPFQFEKDFDERMMYVCLLKQKPAPDLAEKLLEARQGTDRFVLRRSILYLYLASGYGTTKLNNNFFEKKLKVAATTRNWHTLKKLLEMTGYEKE